MDEGVQKELDELSEIAKRVIRRDAANEKDKAEIRRRLPSLRAQDVGPADLERAIHHVYVAGTISRWTKHAAKPDGKRGRPRTS